MEGVENATKMLITMLNIDGMNEWGGIFCIVSPMFNYGGQPSKPVDWQVDWRLNIQNMGMEGSLWP